MRTSIAGAPVSFGVFEMTPEGADVVSPDDMLSALAEAGYRGVDLGPAGFLGVGRELQRRMERFGLELAGGWVQLPFSDDEAYRAALPQLDQALRLFAAAAETGPERLPLPTLADAGSLTRSAAPGRGQEVDRLPNAAHATLLRNSQHAAELVRAAGFEPTFHHHAGTFVESPDEVDDFLANVDIGLTLDVGHLLIGGGDPLVALLRWGERINHLHLKDVDRTELGRVLAIGGGMREVWSSRSFVVLGEGDIALSAFMDAVAESKFDGWIVVEQDVLPRPGLAVDEFRESRARDQQQNIAALAPWIAQNSGGNHP